MKNRKFSKKTSKPKFNQEQDDRLHSPRKPVQKVKYRHKNHWLEEEDIELSPLTNEEE